MLGYHLGLAVLFIGTAVSAPAYRAKPSGPDKPPPAGEGSWRSC